MSLRRISAYWIRRANTSTWPINPLASEKPKNWSGWPNGKKFAVVLTHDVEGPEGLAKCRKLAELEMQLGFKSCFNFVPEGSYTVPALLRNWLTEQGFEVGVHDLEHDGRLFNSRSKFLRKVVRINHYLRNWNASGFRSGFMLRNLDWHHDLDIQYDASTFDTDPFELQSDGVKTIYPFWISAAAREHTRSDGVTGDNEHNSARIRGGYVELPYTLPQDSTLFLVLREKSPDIWLKKTKWIAEHGGMVLVNVHPDYLQFDGEKTSPRTFSVRFYADLLNYIRMQYDDAYWHAVPKDVASYLRHTSLCSTPAGSEPNL